MGGGGGGGGGRKRGGGLCDVSRFICRLYAVHRLLSLFVLSSLDGRICFCDVGVRGKVVSVGNAGIDSVAEKR